jgi:hypothetical protein
MGGIGNGAYGLGPLMFSTGGSVSSAPHAMGMSSFGVKQTAKPKPEKKRATSLFDKSIWKKTANFFGLPEMGRTALDLGKYGGNPGTMMAARAMGAPMKSSLGDNFTTGLNFIPIPVAKLLMPVKNLLAKATNKLALRFASGNVSSSLANRVLGSQYHGGPSGLTSEIMKKQDLNMWNFPGTYMTSNKFTAGSYAEAARGAQGSSLYSFKAKAGEKVSIVNMAKKATDEQKEAVLQALTGGKPLHGTPEMQDTLLKAIAKARPNIEFIIEDKPTEIVDMEGEGLLDWFKKDKKVYPVDNINQNNQINSPPIDNNTIINKIEKELNDKSIERAMLTNTINEMNKYAK